MTAHQQRDQQHETTLKMPSFSLPHPINHLAESERVWIIRVFINVFFCKDGF